MNESLRALFSDLDRFADLVKHDVLYVGSQAAAEIFYREAKLNCPVSTNGPHKFHGSQFQKYRIKDKIYTFDPGTLRDSIYQVMSKDNSPEGKATYHVSWNHEKCPYGFMVEFGTRFSPAVGFMRQAYDNAKDDALAAAKIAISEFLAANR